MGFKKRMIQGNRKGKSQDDICSVAQPGRPDGRKGDVRREDSGKMMDSV